MSFEIIAYDNGTNEFIFHDEFRCESGAILKPLTLVYETYGTLSAKKDNIILIHHALSTNSHVSSHAQNTQPGWWEEMVGVGKPIDTDRFFVICINNLGSCFGSSGPASIDPKTKKPYRDTFPNVTVTDMVRSQKLLLACLGYEKVHAMVGNSVGAMLSLTWAVLYPEDVECLISASSCYKSYPANHANRIMQREIIALDQTIPPQQGFKVARKHALLTYRSFYEINARFIDKKEDASIDHYLNYNAEKFINYFDVYSYLCLLNAMDDFDITKYYDSAKETFSRITAKTLVITVNTDVLYTPDQQMDLYHALKEANVDVELIEHQSRYGHDAFLIEIDRFGSYIRQQIAAD